MFLTHFRGGGGYPVYSEVTPGFGLKIATDRQNGSYGMLGLEPMSLLYWPCARPYHCAITLAPLMHFNYIFAWHYKEFLYFACVQPVRKFPHDLFFIPLIIFLVYSEMTC